MMLPRQTPDFRAKAHILVRQRPYLRTALTNWAALALPPSQTPAAHHHLLGSELRDIADGTNDRLLVLMPPGSAKSTYGSVLFIPWWFMHHPATSVIACAHTEALANEFGGRARGLIAEYPHQLGFSLAARRARHDFTTNRGGSYFATGVHGAVTGRRADLIVIDDPVRGHEDADSAVEREHLWNWYRSDLLTRLKPGGRIVLIMTRWHEDDLGGRLLHTDPSWRCIRLPALAELNDPLHRAIGEPLWPDWENAAQLERKRALIGERQWAALFQQSPRPPGDTLFKLDAVPVIDTAEPIQTVRGWDLAATAARDGADPDWTVGVKLGREVTGRFVVLDVVRLRGSSHQVETAITQTAERDGPDTLISLPQDPGQAGKSQAQYLVGGLAGYRVHASRETGPKATRAAPVASQIEAGNMALLRGGWNAAFLDEARAFPLGRKDDQVDALSRAFAELIAMGPAARRVGAAFMGR